MQSTRTVGRAGREAQPSDFAISTTEQLTASQQRERAGNLSQALQPEIQALSENALPGNDIILSEIAWLSPEQRQGGIVIPPDVQMFLAGRLEAIAIPISPDEHDARRQREGVESLMAASGQYSTPPFSVQVDEDAGVIILRNNWFLQFSPEEKSRLKEMLEKVVDSGDFSLMFKFMQYYDLLKEFVKEYGGIMSTENAFGTAPDSVSRIYEACGQVRSMLFNALDAISSGRSEEVTPQTLTDIRDMSSQIDRAYYDAYLDIGRSFSSFSFAPGDSTELVRQVEDAQRVVQEGRDRGFGAQISFTDAELSILRSFVRRYDEIATEMKLSGMGFQVAAAMLGIRPDSRIASLLPYPVSMPSEETANLLSEFLYVGGVLALFQAKARFFQLWYKYEEYSAERSRVASEAFREGIATTFSPDGLMARRYASGEGLSQEAREFMENRDSYRSELLDLRDRLVAYGEFYDSTISGNLKATFSEMPTFNTEDIRDLFAPLREGIPPADNDDAFVYSTARYFQRFVLVEENVNNYARDAMSALEDFRLQERFRTGDFWDGAYAFSKYFMKYGASDFLFWASLATIGVGMIARGATLGLDAALGAAERGAFRTFISQVGSRSTTELLGMGYRYATTATAVAGIPVWANAMKYFGGDRSPEVVEDLSLMEAFMLSRAGAGGAGFAGRLVATTSAALGTTAATAMTIEDLSRGEYWGAAANAIVVAAGGFMFVKGIGGLMVFEDAASRAAAGTVTVPDASLAPSRFNVVEGYLSRAAEAATHPFTPSGFITFYGGHAFIQTLVIPMLTDSPSQIAMAYEENGLAGVREYLSATYAASASAMPAISLVFSVGGSLYQAAIATSNPLRSGAAFELGAVQATQRFCSEAGFLTSEGQAGEIARIAMSEARLAPEEILARLGVERTEQALSAAGRLNSELLDPLWKRADKLVSGQRLSQQETRQVLQDVGTAAQTSATPSFRGFFTTLGVATTAIAVDNLVGSRLPQAGRIIAARSELISHIDSLDPATSFFTAILSSGGYPGLGRHRFSMQDFSQYYFTMASLYDEIENGPVPTFGTQVPIDMFMSLFPDSGDRMNAMLAYFLMLASHGHLSRPPDDISFYRNGMHNLGASLSQLADAGFSFSGMGLSDIFFLFDYLQGGSSAVSDITDAMDHVSAHRSAYTTWYSADLLLGGEAQAADPQLSRLLPIILSYALDNGKSMDWATYVIDTFLIGVPREQPERWPAEMLYAMLDNPVFQSIDSMQSITPELKQKIIDAWSALQSDPRFPWSVYYPATEGYI